MNAPPSLQHNNNFDFLRTVAATLVLFSHQFSLLGLPDPRILPRISLGHLAVCIFFVISGFLVTQSWERDPNALRFAKRRILRVWPGLIAVTVLSALVLGPLVTSLPAYDYFRADGTLAYFKTLLLNIKYKLPGVFTENPYPNAVNGSLWTIPLEVRWYIVILIAGVIGALKIRVLALIALMTLAVYYLGIYGAETNPNPKYFQELGLFMLYGACLHLYREKWARRPLVFLLVIACAALTAVALGHPFVGLWLALPYMVIAFGTASTPVLRRFGRFGDLSYGIYIYAFPVQQTIIWWLGPQPFAVLLSVSIVIVVAMAYASWHLIESPALRLKPSRAPVGTPPATRPKRDLMTSS
ncbi:MAG: acyltransferase [Acidovorax sp.]|jgi:peptidoglycan/LPS O-acetylase OafA/YrhL|nr:acyltransferase [Acidovorax sp.]